LAGIEPTPPAPGEQDMADFANKESGAGQGLLQCAVIMFIMPVSITITIIIIIINKK
jgi:hypothetical protein